MKVAILGCGPAGLLSAHAAALLGHQPVIYSIPQKSQIHGAQFLHRAIPEINDHQPDAELKFTKVGMGYVYATKVYGKPYVRTSWDNYSTGDRVQAWNMQAAYDKLWDVYQHLIIDHLINAWEVPEILDAFDRVISTVPAAILCRKPYHSFRRIPIWITSAASASVGRNQIVYNGLDADRWYRGCDIFDHRFSEYTFEIYGASPGLKPMGTDCDCFEGRVLKVGRFGKWERGVLIHHAFEEVFDHLQGENSAVHAV